MKITLSSLREYRNVVLLWTLAGVMAASGAIMHMAAVRPVEKKVSALEDEYRKARAEGGRGAENNADASESAEMLIEKLPKWSSFTRVMGEIYGKADRLNLSFSSVSFRPETIQQTGITRVNVSMPVSGSYGEVKRFIYELENSPRYIIINGLSLAGKSNDEGMVSLQLSFMLHFTE